MTNKQFLIAQIKQILERDDLATSEYVRLLALLSKFVPVPAKRRRKPKAKPAPAPKPSVGPFARP